MRSMFQAHRECVTHPHRSRHTPALVCKQWADKFSRGWTARRHHISFAFFFKKRKHTSVAPSLPPSPPPLCRHGTRESLCFRRRHRGDGKTHQQLRLLPQTPLEKLKWRQQVRLLAVGKTQVNCGACLIFLPGGTEARRSGPLSKEGGPDPNHTGCIR